MHIVDNHANYFSHGFIAVFTSPGIPVRIVLYPGIPVKEYFPYNPGMMAVFFCLSPVVGSFFEGTKSWLFVDFLRVVLLCKHF